MALPFFCTISQCSLAVDAVQYLAQEDYISGEDTLTRLQTAAAIGYSIRLGSQPDYNPMLPMISVWTTRINTEREYLKSSVESCEHILLISSGSGQDTMGQIMAGLVCNLGPGKKKDSL